MKVTLYTDDVRSAPVDLIALGVFSDEPDRSLTFSHLNRGLQGTLERACRDENFTGAAGQQLVFNASAPLEAKRVFVFGYGERAQYRPEIVRQFAGSAARVAARVGARTAALTLTILEPPNPEAGVIDLIQAITEGTLLGSYSFSRYKTQADPTSCLQDVRIAFVADDVQGMKGSALRAAIVRGQTVAQAVIFARDVVNEPPNHLTPEGLAERARRIAKDQNLTFKLLGPRELERQGMGLFLEITRGQDHEPRLIHLTYTPENAAKDIRSIAMVSPAFMGSLSMGGAAAVLGTLKALTEIQPTCVVHGIIAAASHGLKHRTRAVMTSKKGLTVEIGDAESSGKLMLADALTYAQDQDVRELLSITSVTEASVLALGPALGAVYANDEGTASRLEAAWKKSAESFWRMPLHVDPSPSLRSHAADLKTGGSEAPSIYEAMFLKHFVNPTTAWTHIDAGGPVISQAQHGYICKGATGFAVRTLISYCGERLR